MCLVEVDIRGGMRRCLIDSNLIVSQWKIPLNALFAKRRIRKDLKFVLDVLTNST